MVKKNNMKKPEKLVVKIIRIGGIGNFYGGLIVKYENNKWWWAIENYDGQDWEEISEELFNLLILHNNKLKK